MKIVRDLNFGMERYVINFQLTEKRLFSLMNNSNVYRFTSKKEKFCNYYLLHEGTIEIAIKLLQNDNLKIWKQKTLTKKECDKIRLGAGENDK